MNYYERKLVDLDTVLPHMRKTVDWLQGYGFDITSCISTSNQIIIAGSGESSLHTAQMLKSLLEDCGITVHSYDYYRPQLVTIEVIYDPVTNLSDIILYGLCDADLEDKPLLRH